MKKRALINYRIPAAANSVFILHDIHLINLAPPVFVVPFYLHVNQPHRCENINSTLEDKQNLGTQQKNKEVAL
jgi:hypothetical protein